MKRLLATMIVRAVLRLLCRIRVQGLSRVPAEGPCLVVTNHINFLEVPLLYLLFQPRRIVGLVKVETWHNPVLGWLADAWEAIPIRRGIVDTRAFRLAMDELARGAFVGVAPEGTRSRTGALQRGKRRGGGAGASKRRADSSCGTLRWRGILVQPKAPAANSRDRPRR